MALEIFKLVMTAETETKTVPTTTNYFHKVETDGTTGVAIEILAANFMKDDGTAATEVATAETDNGFYQVFLNGVLMEAGTYTIDATKLTIDQTVADKVKKDQVLTLSVTNFAPVSTTTVQG